MKLQILFLTLLMMSSLTICMEEGNSNSNSNCNNNNNHLSTQESGSYLPDELWLMIAKETVHFDELWLIKGGIGLYPCYKETMQKVGGLLRVNRQLNGLQLDIVTFCVEKVAQKYGIDRVLAACACNALPVMTYRAEKDPSVMHVPVDSGITALAWAARYRALDVATFLLERGVYVNALNTGGTTALMHLALHSHPDDKDSRLSLAMMKLLVETYGAQVNAKNDEDDTALIYAVRYMQPLPVIEYLLEHGADVNSRDSEGHNALYYAGGRNDDTLATLLQKHGATE